MAKKKIEQPDDEPIGYENVEPEAVEDDVPEGYEVVGEFTSDDRVVITKPGGEAVSLDTPTDEPTYRVTFALPYGVLVALLDIDHPDADLDEAIGKYHLMENGWLTATGKLVLDGFDKIAVGHKMAAAWREQHNREVGK